MGEVKIANEGESARLVLYKDHLSGRVQENLQWPGEYYRVCCFAGETEVATPQGDVPIRDLAGRPALLIPNNPGLGHFREAEVRAFGRQPLLTVTLRRQHSVKEIHATPEHRWVTSGQIGLYGMKRTRELQPGDSLANCYARTQLQRWAQTAAAPKRM